MRLMLLIVLFSGYLSGCSIIVSSIGRSLPRDTKTVEVSQADSVKKGQKVTILMVDGSVLKGRFQGIQSELSAVYNTRFEAWYQQYKHELEVPHLDDLISIVVNSDSVLSGSFKGFDPGILYLQTVEEEVNGVEFENIRRVEMPGQMVWSKIHLSTLFEDEQLPVRSHVVIQRQGQTIQYIHPQEVDHMTYSKHYGGAGFALGFIMDVLLLVRYLNNAI